MELDELKKSRAASDSRHRLPANCTKKLPVKMCCTLYARLEKPPVLFPKHERLPRNGWLNRKFFRTASRSQYLSVNTYYVHPLRNTSNP